MFCSKSEALCESITRIIEMDLYCGHGLVEDRQSAVYGSLMLMSTVP